MKSDSLPYSKVIDLDTLINQSAINDALRGNVLAETVLEQIILYANRKALELTDEEREWSGFVMTPRPERFDEGQMDLPFPERYMLRLGHDVVCVDFIEMGNSDLNATRIEISGSSEIAVFHVYKELLTKPFRRDERVA